MNIFHIGVKVYEICFLFIDVMVLIEVYSLVLKICISICNFHSDYFNVSSHKCIWWWKGGQQKLHPRYAETCKMSDANLDKCTSSNHASGNFGAVWNMLVPVSKGEYITISNDMQIVKSLLCTLVDIVPISKFAVALLPWSTMYCYGWSTPVVDIWNYRISTIPALKESCSYLKPSNREEHKYFCNFYIKNGYMCSTIPKDYMSRCI